MRRKASLSRRPMAFSVALLLLLTLPAWADTIDQRASLQGLPGVSVMIDAIGPPYGRDALSIPELQAAVELRLRQHGIRVITEAGGRLSLRVTTTRDHVDAYAVHLALHLLQVARLERKLKNPMQFLLSTWDADSLLFVAPTDFLREVRPKVVDLLDRFIDAYLEQNPTQ